MPINRRIYKQIAGYSYSGIQHDDEKGKTYCFLRERGWISPTCNVEKPDTRQPILCDCICRMSRQTEFSCGDGGWRVVTLGVILTGRKHEQASWAPRSASVWIYRVARRVLWCVKVIKLCTSELRSLYVLHINLKKKRTHFNIFT